MIRNINFKFAFAAFIWLTSTGNASPKQIVTLAPSLAEMVMDLNDNDSSKIAAVSDFSDYPEQMRTKPSIGALHHFDIERVLSYQPDLVIATQDGNSPAQITRLKQLGVKVLVLSVGTFDQIENAYFQLGKALEKTDRAQHLVDHFRGKVAQFRNGKKTSLKVALFISDTPWMAVSGKTYLGEAISLTGATNVFESSSDKFPRPSLEWILTSPIDQIYLLSMNQSRPHKSLTKVRTITIPELLRPTFRVLDGVEKLRKLIHEEK